MDLKVSEVARILNLKEESIEQMAQVGQIPAYEMNGQLRFSRTEIEAWVMAREQQGEPVPGGQEGIHHFNLFRGVHRGGVLVDVPGDTKEEVVRNTTCHLAERLSLDSEVLADLLLDRERLMPTSLGEGVAVPHAREFLLNRPYDLVTVVFPKDPLSFGALDGKPVHTLFFLFACQDDRHLNLLAKIAHLATNEEARTLLQSKPDQPSLLAFLRDWESQLASQS